MVGEDERTVEGTARRFDDGGVGAPMPRFGAEGLERPPPLPG